MASSFALVPIPFSFFGKPISAERGVCGTFLRCVYIWTTMQSAQKRRNVVRNSILQAVPDVHPFVFVPPLCLLSPGPQLGLRFKGEDTREDRAYTRMRACTQMRAIEHRERYGRKSVLRIPMRFLHANRSYPPPLFDLSRCIFVLTRKREREREKDYKDFNDNER